MHGAKASSGGKHRDEGAYFHEFFLEPLMLSEGLILGHGAQSDPDIEPFLYHLSPIPPKI